MLSAFDAKTGKPHYQVQRLDGARSVLVTGRRRRPRLYHRPHGTTIVLKHGPTFEVLAENTLDDGFDASPALVGDTIYIRGYKNLYAIGN